MSIDKLEIEEIIKDYLKSKLSVHVSSKSQSNYLETHILLKLDGEVISDDFTRDYLDTTD